MEKETKIELVLDVYGWITDRERIMLDIEVELHKLFLQHKRTTGQHRSTGCFTVELSLPKVEPLPNLNVHPTGPECTESCLHGFGCTKKDSGTSYDDMDMGYRQAHNH